MAVSSLALGMRDIMYTVRPSPGIIMADPDHSDVARLPFERAIEELESIV